MRSPAHDPHLLASRGGGCVSVSRGHQPAEGFGLGRGDSFVVQLGVEVRRVDGTSELPVGQQHRGDDQTEEQRDECRPAEAAQLKPCSSLALTVVAPRKDATRAWAARRVPVRCRIPTTLS